MPDLPRPLETEPTHILLNRINKLLALLFRISIIKAKVATATELLRKTKIHGNRFRVANMQKAIWLWGKSSH